MSRIGIDARLWNETGVGRYIRNLVSELSKIDKKNEYVLFLKKDTFDSLKIPAENFKKVLADIHWHTFKEQLQFSQILTKEKLDLVHFPYFSVPVAYPGSFVVTIHDLILHHFPTGKASMLPLPLYWAKQIAYRLIIWQTALRAKKIITVSHATAGQIEKDLGIKTAKIVVTYEGVDEKLLTVNHESLTSNNPYFLYVGNAYPHKNLERLLDAFLLFHQHDNTHTKLILVGKKDYFYNRLQAKIVQMELQEYAHIESHVTDDTLMHLYSGATALIIPSLMEGFGLPGLEAISNKCIVLCSEIPVFKEIYEDAVIYFDPLRIEDIAKKLENLQNMKQEEKKLLQEKGNKILQHFSWKHMAAQTQQVYESSIGIR